MRVPERGNSQQAPGGSPMFQTTHWSVVLQAAGGDSAQSRHQKADQRERECRQLDVLRGASHRRGHRSVPTARNGARLVRDGARSGVGSHDPVVSLEKQSGSGYGNRIGQCLLYDAVCRVGVVVSARKRQSLMKTKILFTTLLILALFTAGSAQTLDKAKLDQFFDRLAEKNKAMGSLTIAKEDNVVYTRAIGYGVWTKADSVTLFDDFTFGSAK